MSPPAPASGLVIDARDPAGRAPLLGLRGYERALLAAHHAGLESLHLWLPAEDPAARAEAERFLGDPRLGGVAVALHEAESSLPSWVRVDARAVFDRAAAAALAAGRDPAAAGTYLPPGTPGVAGRLLRSLENPCDGVVDTWLNRPISRVLTRLLLPTGISPNAVTVLSFLIGVVGVGLIATRRYELALAGALAFQLSAAVDCVDGELARLTYRFSPLGARLDLALDNVVHVLLFLALGWAAAPALGLELAAGLGLSAALGGALGFAVVWRLTFHPRAGAGSERIRALLDKVTNRDFSVLVIAAVAAGRPEWLLWLLATGTHGFWILLVWVSRPRADEVPA